MCGSIRTGRAAPPAALLTGLLLACGCAGVQPRPRTPDPYLLELPCAGGGQVDFSAFRGRVLLVDFFTTWNQASILAVPGLAGLHRRYAARGLAVVGVALDELGADVVVPYAQGMDIPYPVALAGEAIREGTSTFGDLSVLPVLFVFDTRGTLRKVFVGYVPLEKIEKLVVELLP